VELQWADPAYARFLHRLGSMARVIVYDKRGAGLSGRLPEAPTVEDHARDLDVLLATAARGRAVVLGFSDGSPAAGLFVASHPDRCLALILCASWAKTRGEDELVARVQASTRPFRESWGEGNGLAVFAPSLARSRVNRANYAVFERASLRAEDVQGIAERSMDVDVSEAFRRVAVPTLVLHRSDDFIPIEAGRHAASLIPHARFVELVGGDHVPFAGDTTPLILEVERFVRQVTEQPKVPPSRVAVLFTDIVGSTERLQQLGDERWRDVVGIHDDLSRQTIADHGGTAVKSTGDGWLATFAAAPDAVRAAWTLGQQVQRLGLEVRAGIHCGPVESVPGDVVGETVHTAARIAAVAGADEVLVSEEAAALCAGAEMSFEPAGRHVLKGLPQPWDLLRLSGDPGERDPVVVEPAPPLRGADRVAVRVASRMPAVTRTVTQLASRW
jgi:class 3 adenylate cyclase